MIKKIAYIVIILVVFSSCKSNDKWQKARVVFYDNYEKEMFVKSNKHSYYNFVKARENIHGKTEILIPEDVLLVETQTQKFTKLYFDEETFLMESYSFGHCLAGDSLMLVETKYQAKTCACKTSGTYFKGYFLVYNEDILKIKTDSKNNVYNRGKIYEFVDKYSDYSLPKNINTIQDIIDFLENINN